MSAPIAGTLHSRLWAGPAGAHVQTVVLLHGLLSSRSLVPMAQRVARSCRVVAPDLPGFGRSPASSSSLSIAETADLVAAWTGTSSLHAAVVVGHSVGAQVIAELAVRHPAMVGGAVLVAPTVDPQARRVRSQFGCWLANAPSEPLSFNLLAAYELVEVGPQRMVQTVRHAIDDLIEDTLPAVSCPVLLIRGERDRVVPQRWVDHLHRRAPGSQVAVIPEAAHTVVYNAPARLAQIIVDFAAVNRTVGALGSIA
jgi:2-hydroxy-6-oxonona-2,4-dienedioate hydrolase